MYVVGYSNITNNTKYFFLGYKMHILVLETITTASVKDSRSETLKKPIYYVILFDQICV